MTDGIGHSPPPSAPKKVSIPEATLKKIDEQALGFEAMFMSQMLEFMWSGIESNEYFGGGHGEDTWRSMLIQEYGSISSKAGNLGIADNVRAELIKMQEKMMPPAPADSEPTLTKGEEL
ncbi:MAG: rod-binding protein [Bdellovibrionales bacterium]